jgi:hypothetical protein
LHNKSTKAARHETSAWYCHSLLIIRAKTAGPARRSAAEGVPGLVPAVPGAKKIRPPLERMTNIKLHLTSHQIEPDYTSRIYYASEVYNMYKDEMQGSTRWVSIRMAPRTTL